MSILNIANVSHSFGDFEIFNKISFSVEPDSRIGLVGKNGSGKSTLFNLITGRIFPNQGEIHKSKECQIIYLTQEPDLNSSQTLYNYVLESRQDYIELSNKLKKAEQALSLDHSQQNMERYSLLQSKFEHIDGYKFKTEIKLVLNSLKFPESVWKQRIAKFSGGEKTRIQLAKFLLQRFDLILLDEPTNHLDMEMIYWLESYLKKIQKPYIIISHDRHFLDKTVNKIIEIKDKSLSFYSGNYSFYKQESTQRALLQEKEYNTQQKKLKKMDNQIKQYRIWGKARDSEVMYKRAKELEKRRTKIEAIDKPLEQRSINLSIQIAGRSGNDVYHLENVTFGFQDKMLAKNIDLNVHYQDRIAVLGRNGCGKTTLLRLLNEEIKPLHGIIKKGASLKVGYYDQMHLILNDELTVMETLWQLVPMEAKGYVLSFLARFGFRGDDVDKKVGILSGGEKARLYLSKLIHEKPNLLIFDEPTNHLDINMIDSLEEALLNYEGTIIFVSHDTYFIQKLAKRKWFFQNDTIIETELSLEKLFTKSEIKFSKQKKDKTKSNQKSVNPIVLEKLYAQIDKLHTKIEQINKEVLFLEREFHNPKIYKNDHKIKLLNKQLKEKKLDINLTKVELEKFENEYLELSE